ncbi:MAG: helicase-related protein, partial [Bacillota bacterium]
MLREFLTERGFQVVCLNGSMDMEERLRVEDAFAGRARFLVSTDAGGEGLNLQFCHVVINYDIPWNPMRLEQRIGRVDRIGQTNVVRAVNFVFENSVEHRVLQVLEEKLAVILEEFGIDKTGDVLDSAQAGQIFDDLYAGAILDPDVVETKVSEVVETIRQQAREARAASDTLGSAGDLDPAIAQSLLAHPLSHWVERMTVNYLRAFGGKVEARHGAWNLTWPDGEAMPDVVFSGKGPGGSTGARYLTLEEPRVRDLAARLPRFVSGQPVMMVALSSLPPDITGIWALWQISISPVDPRRRRIMPLFLADDGRTFPLTARHVWDHLLTAAPVILGHLDVEASERAFSRAREAAEQHGRAVYEELARSHRDYLAHEREKGEYAFAARRKTIELIGLPQVRNHRLALLEREELEFRQDLERRTPTLPEMTALVLVRVEGGSHD